MSKGSNSPTIERSAKIEVGKQVLYIALTVMSFVSFGYILILFGSKTPLAGLMGGMLDPLWRRLLGFEVTSMIVARSLGLGIGGLLAALLLR